MNPITWLTGRFGERAARWIVYLVLFIGLLFFAFVMKSCVDFNQRSAVTAQAEQTTRSSEAIAEAANDAVNQVDKRASIEQQIDAATAVALEDINHAENPDDVRNAVAAAVCMRDTSRFTDPACVVR